MRYLSLEWIDAVNDAVSGDDTLVEISRSTDFGITQVVTGGPEGDVVYHFTVGDGEVSFGPGPAPREDVRLKQSWETSVAVATGTMSAQELFVKGLVVVSGDVQKLIASQHVFAPLDAAFGLVRTATVYE